MSPGIDPILYGPYPELVEPVPGGAPYRIRDSASDPRLPSRGAVDQKQRRMWVPLAPDGRAVGRHELGHAWLSPKLLPHVAFEPGVLAAVEDARVNLALLRAGLPSDLDFEAEATVMMLAARDAKRGDAFALFQRSIASLGTSVVPVLRALLARDTTPSGAAIERWMQRTEHVLTAAAVRRGRPEAPFRVGLALARLLARELRAYGLLDEAGRARTPSVVRCCAADDGETGLVGARHAHDGLDAESCADESVASGRLVVRSMPLSVALRARGGVRAWRAGSEGAVVRYLHRFATDRAVFRRRARARGGTVLVDASGSMSIGVADLDRFLLAVPIGTRVALYAGDGDAGELRIVAEGGRRAAASDLERFGRGNVVDVPALEWLVRQRAPRVWVSDGGVTGVGDRPSARLVARCRELRRRAAIRRVPTLTEAAALF